eukprot:3319896-Amphidinium_carterae.1
MDACRPSHPPHCWTAIFARLVCQRSNTPRTHALPDMPSLVITDGVFQGGPLPENPGCIGTLSG